MYQFDKEAFGQKLKTAIKNRYPSQEQFCKESGIPSGTLRSYLDGKTEPGAENLKMIADALSTSVDDLLENKAETSITIPQTITPKDIINSINTLTEAFGYECIEQITSEMYALNYNGYPEKEEVKHYAICIPEQTVQYYLYQLKTKGHLKKELASVGEEETYYKLLNKWANIDDTEFIDGHICGILPDDLPF